MFNPVDFRNPPANVKVHNWWHWLDGAITREGITRDLEAMKKQGIGQATILNIGLFNGKDFGVQRVIFNTPQWHEMFLWALKEANRLGITIGAHNCDGWSSSGGPWITPEMSMKQFVWSKTNFSGGKKISTSLTQPNAERNFYKDVAVIAFPSIQAGTDFKIHSVYKMNGSTITNCLSDGDPSSEIAVKKDDKILVTFDKTATIGKIVIHPRKKFMWKDAREFTSSYVISSSIDGITFTKIKDLQFKGLNQSVSTELPVTKARYFQVLVKDVSDIDSFIDITLAELEFLPGDGTPSFNPSVHHVLEKSGSIKPYDRSCFDSSDSLYANNVIPENQIINLSDKMDEKGILHWTAPKGRWTVIRFGYTTTGAQNGPATKEGSGLECDKMDTTALNLHFKNFPKKLAETAGKFTGNTFKFILIDSWECGYQNWTANLPAQFEQNRGYSLIKWIPVLCGETVGDSKLSDAFLYDFRKTIADMIENNYYKHFRDLCHKEKLEMHAEIIYGDANYPALDILKSNSYADLPMFEFWAGHNKNTFVEYSSSKPFESFPVFGALGYNIPVVGSEAYTGMGHYSEAPNDFKSFGDRAFCSGINQIILHSYVHQPFDKKPGMTLGDFGSSFNRNNLFYQQASGWLNYQSRIQYVLQKGKIASNVLYYIGDQLPQYIDNPTVNNLPFGYRGIACNLDMLKNKATVRNGKIVLDNGIEYELLILPVSNAMEISTLKRIEELVSQGALVYGLKPVMPLSMSGQTGELKEFKELTAKIWGITEGATKNKLGKGIVYSGMSIAQVLNDSKIVPEFKTNVSDSMNLMYIHKKYGSNDVYFVANQKEFSFNRQCEFAVGDKTPYLWNPMDGSILKPEVYTSVNGIVSIPVSFKPRESMIFVFENQPSNTNLSKVFSGNRQIFPLQDAHDSISGIPFAVLNGKDYNFTSDNTGSYSFVTTNLQKINKDLKQPEIITIKNPEATIEFKTEYDSKIAPVTVHDLKSFTEFDDPQIKYFSGTANYSISFSVPENILKSDDVLLDLGKFESSVKVSLNDTDLGIAWMPGNKFRIKGLLKKTNKLEVEVVNVYRNRIIGDYIQFGKLKNIWTSSKVEQFLDKDKPLKPSGLMGPLSIEIMNTIK